MSAFETSFHPWLSIWTKPRMAIARIVQDNPNRGLWWLALIYGFSSVLNAFQSMQLGREMGIVPLFVLAAVIGPLWGYVSFSIWAWVVAWTGKLFKGTGSFKSVRAAYAWSCCPLIINVLLWFVLAGLFGRALFTNISEGYPLTQVQVSLLFLILLVRIAVAIWSLVIYFNALAEVQQFSVLRAIGNVIVSAILIAIVFYVLVFLLSGGWRSHPGLFLQKFFFSNLAIIEPLRPL